MSTPNKKSTNSDFIKTPLPTDYIPFGDGYVARVGQIPMAVSYAALQAIVGYDGQEACIPKLVGPGHTRCRYIASTGRWAVDAGQVIASAVAPFSVVNASSTTAVDYSFLTIPADMFGLNEEFEIEMSFETASGNSGSDSATMIIGSQPISSVSEVANSSSPYLCRLYRYPSNTLRKALLSTGTLFNTAIAVYSVDMATDTNVKLRIIPGTIGNTSYIRRVSIRRVS